MFRPRSPNGDPKRRSGPAEYHGLPFANADIGAPGPFTPPETATGVALSAGRNAPIPPPTGALGPSNSHAQASLIANKRPLLPGTALGFSESAAAITRFRDTNPSPRPYPRSWANNRSPPSPDFVLHGAPASRTSRGGPLLRLIRCAFGEMTTKTYTSINPPILTPWFQHLPDTRRNSLNPPTGIQRGLRIRGRWHLRAIWPAQTWAVAPSCTCGIYDRDTGITKSANEDHRHACPRQQRDESDTCVPTRRVNHNRLGQPPRAGVRRSRGSTMPMQLPGAAVGRPPIAKANAPLSIVHGAP